MKKKSKINKDLYHILVYVLDSTPMIKRFNTTEEMGKFIDDFNAKYPESEANDSGNWTDFAVTGITGEIHQFTDGVPIE